MYQINLVIQNLSEDIVLTIQVHQTIVGSLTELHSNPFTAKLKLIITLQDLAAKKSYWENRVRNIYLSNLF